MLVSTPLRQSLGKTTHTRVLTPHNHLNDSAISVIQEDETERQKRRSLADFNRRVAAVPQQSPASVVVDTEEVKDHFNLCVKLFSENKINIKNAWNLKIIDYLKTLLTQDIVGKDTMLVAATSLDISTKIYACRVDDVHAKGLKLASTLHNLDHKQVNEDGNEDNAAVVPNEEPKASKKKKRQGRGSNSIKPTVNKDGSSLFLTDVSYTSEICFTGGINIDGSTMDNMFTSKVLMNHPGCKFTLLNSTDSAWVSDKETDNILQENKKYGIKYEYEEKQICPSFADFHVDEWDPDQEEALITNETQVHNVNEDVVLDEQGVPVAELDGSVHDIFADGPANDLDDFEEGLEQQADVNHEVEMIESFCPNKSRLKQDDFLYNGIISNKDLDTWMKRLWTGPSHWKNKILRQSTSKFTGRTEKIVAACKSKKKSKDFSTIIDFENPKQTPFDFSKKYKALKKVRYDPTRYTLPINYLAMAPDLRLLITKPYPPEREFQGKPKDDDYEHSPYDYDNPNDSQYCSQNSIMGDHDDNEPAFENVNHTQEETILNYQKNREQGENIAVWQENEADGAHDDMLDAPELVAQTFIPYALRAKKMNMKLLKNYIWDTLTGKETINSANPQEEVEIKRTLFTTLHSTLPTILPENMCKDLSPHLAFVALLHLVNEYNLKLTGQPDLNDIVIEQDHKTTKRRT